MGSSKRDRFPMHALTDGFGRTARDLRIAVTDRCNLRCTYCMADDPAPWQPHAEILTYEEIIRLARLFVEGFGIDGIRLTGGEPTLRTDLGALVAGLSRLTVSGAAASERAGAAPDIAITTNGTTLRRTATVLRAAGVRRVNISLDTLRADRFTRITRRDNLPAVLDGIDAASAAGFDSVKLNVVVERGVNHDEILDLAAFGRERHLEVRFIEFMPLDGGGRWTRERVVTEAEIVATIDAVFPLRAMGDRGSSPALRWSYADGAGAVGVIASVSRPFCNDCDRVRLTADGHLRACLFSTTEVDLRSPLRHGGTDEEISEHIRDAFAMKTGGHAIETATFLRPRRPMSQIGG